ncbi:MAG: hypothetical protein QGG73_06550 [Candidatus Hydrogenedentes bacterium]|nr:hypothetical protein [Candidatus Hydrogenedentota bacterium]
MFSLPQLVVPITAGFAAVALLVLIAPTRRSNRAHARGQIVGFDCPSCQQTLLIHPGEMAPISPVEIALVVSVKPSVVGRALGEYRCPYCDADHCFAIEAWPPEYVTSNAYESQAFTTHCPQCHKALRKPGWPPGDQDENALANSDMSDDHGLVCYRCEGVSCVSCCRGATRNRTKDGSLLCPRCDRGPVEKVFRF